MTALGFVGLCLPRASGGPPLRPIYRHNGARYLGEALDSLLAQTFGDFELIVADNASTDGTEAICRGYAAADHAGYAWGVRHAGPRVSERARVYGAPPRWLGRDGNWARLAVDPVIAVASSMAPFFLWLAASNRRRLAKRADDVGG